MPTLIVADDHPLMLEGVSGLFANSRFQVLARCLDGAHARLAIAEHRPDVAVLDVNMPGRTGLEILREARAERWPTKIVLLTASIETAPLVEAVKLKVDGLVLKDSAGEMLLRAVEAALAGRPIIDTEAMKQVMAALAAPDPYADAPDLTPRETDVARLVAHGRRNKEIARELGITEGTVKMHLHNLYEKLSISSRTELALLARDRKIAS